jgi:arylsulfatase A-like enzyme
LSALAGVELAASELADGRRLDRVFLGRDPVGRDHLVTEGFGAKTVLRQGPWVYLPAHPGALRFGDKDIESGNSSETQLYNLETDSGQRRNLAAEHPERVAALRALLEAGLVESARVRL